jgi:hypothetical protein
MVLQQFIYKNSSGESPREEGADQLPEFCHLMLLLPDRMTIA